MPREIELEVTPYKRWPTKYKAIHILAVILEHDEGILETTLRHRVNGNSKRNAHFRDTLEKMREAGIIRIKDFRRGIPVIVMQTKLHGEPNAELPSKPGSIPPKPGGVARYFVKHEGLPKTLSKACSDAGLRYSSVYNRAKRGGLSPQKLQESFAALLQVKSEETAEGGKRALAPIFREHSSDPVFAHVNSVFAVRPE